MPVSIERRGDTMGRVTNLNSRSVGPCFSPDGRQIAFTSGKGQIGAGSRAWLMDADGGNLRKLPSFGRDDFCPVFDRAGDFIAYASDMVGEGLVSDSTINIVDVDGRLIRQIARPGTDYVFSPDGHYLAFSTGVEIYIEAIHKGRLVRLTDTFDPEKRLTGPSPRNRKPVFHPSKDLIAFTSSRDRPEREEVYTMKQDGTQQTRLTFMENGATNPIFNPDGTGLYFISVNPFDRTVPCIFKVNNGGSGLKPLTSSKDVYGDVSLSPDGRWLLYTSYSNEEQKAISLDISLLNVISGEAYKLIHDGYYNRYPCFSPDLASIVYCSRRDKATEIYSLDIQPLAS